MATCPTNTIDSNGTGLRIAEEECITKLPTTPTWNVYEPNSYSDFGSTSSLLARNPINPSRQRKKGKVTDIEATAGFSSDLTATNLTTLLQGFFFADIRTKSSYMVTGASADIKVAVTPGSLPTLTATALDFTTLGLVPGDWIYIGGDAATDNFNTAANNGFKRVRSVAAGVLTLDKSESTMVTDAGAGKLIKIYMGKVLRNEQAADIKRRTYQIERTLGRPNSALQNEQAEYIVGAVPSEAVFNFPSADKVTVDLSFMAAHGETRTQTQGLKSGTRPTLVETDAFSTAVDLKRVRLSEIVASDELPVPLFSFVLESTLTLNNTLSGNKALGVIGNFEITAGTFEVGGSITAYFSSVEAIRAVQNNVDVTMDYIMVNSDNKGIVIDVPLMALGDGRAAIEQDRPVTLPLTTQAASGAKIHSSLDYTLCMVFFEQLPEVASL